MMDSRAHGASGGEIASYGWLERKDLSAEIDALEREEHPVHVFALGNSMGAGIALQAAGSDPRIEAAMAEAPFADSQEAAYDYAGLHRWPWLGKTLFAPGAWTVVYRGGKLAGFPVSEVSPVKAVQRRAFPVLRFATAPMWCCHAAIPKKSLVPRQELRNCGACRMRCTPGRWVPRLTNFGAACWHFLHKPRSNRARLLRASFASLAEPAHGFAHADRECGYGFEAFERVLGKRCVFFAGALRREAVRRCRGCQ